MSWDEWFMDYPREESEVYYLSKVECAIYYFFLNRIFVEQSYVYSGGQKTLATLIGCHENSVVSAVKSLEIKGLLKRTKDGSKNILQFTPPNSELHCRMSYCSGINFGSYSHTKLKEDFKQIIANLQLEVQSLQQELFQLQKEQQELQEKRKSITKQQIYDFVESLLKRLGNNFDKDSLEEKILKEIQLFKERISDGKGIEDSPSTLPSQPTSLNKNDWKSKEVLEGFREIEKLKRKM